MLLPGRLRVLFDDAFPRIGQAARQARAMWLREHKQEAGDPFNPPQRIASDCAGIEAGLTSLMLMKLPYVHEWSCDVSPCSKLWVLQNFKPKLWFDDAIKRDLNKLGNVTLDGLEAGFPCQPFSRKNRWVRHFKDKRTKVLIAVLKAASHFRVPWLLLENVPGVLQHLDRFRALILKHLVDGAGVKLNYILICVPFSPREFKDPLRRPRVWFVLLRRDLLVTQDMSALQSLATCIVAAAVAAKAPMTVHDYLLPTGSSNGRVAAVRGKNRSTSGHKGVKKQPGKWQHEHARIRRDLGLSSRTVACPPANLSHRALDVLNMKTEQASKKLGGVLPQIFACDVSQSFRFAATGFDEIPCLSTSSEVVLQQRGALPRMISSEEMLTVHQFPLHKVSIPTALSKSDLSKLAGNTQHVGVAGVMLLMTTGLIDWRARRSLNTATDAAIAIGARQWLPTYLWRWDGTKMTTVTKTKNGKMATSMKAKRVTATSMKARTKARTGPAATSTLRGGTGRLYRWS